MMQAAGLNQMDRSVRLLLDPTQRWRPPTPLRQPNAMRRPMHRSYHLCPGGAVTWPLQWCALELGDRGETLMSEGGTN
jgi:hypothetical protein